VNQPGLLLGALLGGLAVGWVFFYGLHRTVQALARTRHPAQLLAASLLARIALLGAAFWLLLQAGGDWPHLLAAFAGVMLMRLILLRRFGKAPDNPKPRQDPRQ